MPIVLSVTTAAAGTGRIWYGGLLLLVFGLGRALPLLIAGLSADFVKRIEVVASYMMPYLERVFGFVFLGLGGYYLYIRPGSFFSLI